MVTFRNNNSTNSRRSNFRRNDETSKQMIDQNLDLISQIMIILKEKRQEEIIITHKN